jgi:hypothetical protein
MVTEDMLFFLIRTGIAVVILILLLIIQISIMRLISILKARSRHKVIAIWRPILVQEALGEETSLPTIRGNDWRYIAEEWNKLIGTVRGEARQNLTDLAWKINLHHYVKNQVFRKGSKNRLFAMVTLGHMRAAIKWSDLVHVMKKSRSTISLVAAQAMIQINPVRALKQIIPLLEQRTDWHWAGVAHIFRLANSDVICPALEQLIRKTPDDSLPGLLRILDTIKCDTSSAIIGEVLNRSKNDRVTSTCLHIVNDPRSVYAIRQYIDCPRWHVRMHAATALGRLGLEEDIPVLISCLQDREWWVRYRAAQALAAMPFVSIKELQNIYETQQDRYAKDILQQVISERQYYAE